MYFQPLLDLSLLISMQSSEMIGSTNTYSKRLTIMYMGEATTKLYTKQPINCTIMKL